MPEFAYFHSTRDDVIVRRNEENRVTEVWHPKARKWAEYPVDVAHETRAITEADATDLGANVKAGVEDAEFGEFAPENKEES